MPNYPSRKEGFCRPQGPFLPLHQTAPFCFHNKKKQGRIKGCGQKIRSKVPILQVKRVTGFDCEFQRSLREQQMSYVVSLNYTQCTETS
jgi:hypothetical protein